MHVSIFFGGRGGFTDRDGMIGMGYDGWIGHLAICSEEVPGVWLVLVLGC